MSNQNYWTEIVIGEPLSHIDESQTKSRAIIFNKQSEILLAKYAGVYMLPGGKVDDGEAPDDAICRELKEETGLAFPNLQSFKKLICLQKDYPTRDGQTINRVLTTYYYIGNEAEATRHERNLTEKEIRGGFVLKYCAIGDLEKILEQNESSNPRNSFFNDEIRAIIGSYITEFMN